MRNDIYSVRLTTALRGRTSLLYIPFSLVIRKLLLTIQVREEKQAGITTICRKRRMSFSRESSSPSNCQDC